MRPIQFICLLSLIRFRLRQCSTGFLDTRGSGRGRRRLPSSSPSTETTPGRGRSLLRARRKQTDRSPTIQKAQDAVRELRKANPNRERPVVVQIRGGVYAMSEPLTFLPGDSGTESSPTIYEAYPVRTSDPQRRPWPFATGKLTNRAGGTPNCRMLSRASGRSRSSSSTISGVSAPGCRKRDTITRKRRLPRRRSAKGATTALSLRTGISGQTGRI